MAARRRKLLLADDSLTIQKVVSLTFSDEGIEVVTASDGRQALLLLEESPPDIVLADTYMPGPNGYHLCEHVKGDPRLRHIPVVLLVGTFEPFNEAEARRVGADMVLTKPFQSIKELVSKVGSLFGGGRADDAEDEPTTRNLTPPPAAREDARRAAAAPAQPWQEPRVTEAAAPVSEHASAPPVADSAAEVSFGQLELDDPMIEAREVEPVSLGDETGTRQPA
ncbi:MAG TPA: response regulator, partial [Pyrinomonadaceae bacterium]|nr:response regulator [Pyrinomonadaceae bacterium]